jgi:hypothetical protein
MTNSNQPITLQVQCLACKKTVTAYPLVNKDDLVAAVTVATTSHRLLETRSRSWLPLESDGPQPRAWPSTIRREAR